MTFALGTSDAYPYVCGIYTCRCGRRSIRHGRFAGLLPAGWIEREDGHGEPLHVCAACARPRERRAQEPA